MTSENVGLSNNTAELIEVSNDLGLPDIDSTPGNKNVSEDDFGKADVIITINEDKKVDSFRIGFGTPRWMSSLSMNGYYTKSWKCNLKDYLGG